jgi:hypothetical protein
LPDLTAGLRGALGCGTQSSGHSKPRISAWFVDQFRHLQSRNAGGIFGVVGWLSSKHAGTVTTTFCMRFTEKCFRVSLDLPKEKWRKLLRGELPVTQTDLSHRSHRTVTEFCTLHTACKATKQNNKARWASPGPEKCAKVHTRVKSMPGYRFANNAG